MEILSCKSLSNVWISKFDSWLRNWVIEEDMITVYQQPLNYYSSLPKYIMMVEDDEILGCVLVDGSARDRAIIQIYGENDYEVEDALIKRAVCVCEKHHFKEIYVREYNKRVDKYADGWRYTKNVAYCDIKSDLCIKVADSTVFQEMAKCHFSLESVTYDEAETFVDKAMKSKDSLVLGIYQGDVLVGSSVIDFYQKHAAMRCFGIHPVFQGNGLGTKALRLLENKLHESGYETLTKDVIKNNDFEKRFYEANNFHQIASFKFINMGNKLA